MKDSYLKRLLQIAVLSLLIVALSATTVTANERVSGLMEKLKKKS